MARQFHLIRFGDPLNRKCGNKASGAKSTSVISSASEPVAGFPGLIAPE